MVKTGLFVFIAVSAILVTLSESAQIPSKDDPKVVVIAKIEAKKYVTIPEKSEIASKEDAKLPENTVVVPQEKTNLPEVLAILLNEPEITSNPEVKPQKDSTQVKPVIAASAPDAETAAFLASHPEFTSIGTYEDKYFFYQQKSREYESAKKACERAGAGSTLVEIDTVDEANYIWARTPVAMMWTSGGANINYVWSVTGAPVTLFVNENTSTVVHLVFDATFADTRTQLIAKPTTAKALPLCQKLISLT